MYRYRFTRFSVCMLFAVCTLLLSSCGTRAPRVDYRELARAAVRLEMDIDANDNHRLYVEVADWIGVPYRHGGSTHRGTDCSGFTSAVYKKVYHKKLQRNSDAQRTEDCRKVSKRQLKEGDLVFFHNGRRKRVANHVGIYLKDGKFYESPVHKVHSFEAVGAGDAFGAGLIHAMAHDFAPQRTIDFAISASVLKLMIQHDANVVSEKEIEQIMKQGGTNLQR